VWHQPFPLETIHRDPSQWITEGSICMAILQDKHHLVPFYVLGKDPVAPPATPQLLAVNLSKSLPVTGPALFTLPLGQPLHAGKLFKATPGGLAGAASNPLLHLAPPGGQRSTSMYKLSPVPTSWLGKIIQAEASILDLQQESLPHKSRTLQADKELHQWLLQAATLESPTATTSSLSLPASSINPLALAEAHPSLWTSCQQHMSTLPQELQQAWATWTSDTHTAVETAATLGAQQHPGYSYHPSLPPVPAYPSPHPAQPAVHFETPIASPPQGEQGTQPGPRQLGPPPCRIWRP
jgi:hypothetical protein